MKSPRKRSTDARVTGESEEPTGPRLRDHERDAGDVTPGDAESRAQRATALARKASLFGVRARGGGGLDGGAG